MKRYVAGTPIIVVTRFSAISCSARAGSKAGSSTTVAPFHHASSGWTFQPPTWNCGSTCSTVSSALSAGDAVEGEVRPEAVRVREQRALRLPGRARGVDEQEAVAVLGLRRGTLQQAVARLSSGAVRSCRLAPSSANSGRAEEHRRLRVLELVAELRRREPRVQRHQDQSRLRAGEEDDDVLRARRRQRRDAVARREPGLEQAGRERVGARIELARRSSPRRRSRSRRGRASSGHGRGSSGRASIHSRRNSVTIATNDRAAPRRRGGRRPGRARRGHRGSRRASRAAFRGSTTASPSRAGRASARRSRRHGRGRRRPRPPPPARSRRRTAAPSPRGGAGSARRSRSSGSGASAFSTNWRSVARARQQLHRLLGHRERLRPAGRRAGEHEPVDALRSGERELLRDHAAEARAEHVGALDPGLVEHLRRVARPARPPCTARAARRSRRCRGCRRGSRRTTARAARRPAPSPSARSRGRGSGAAARPLP